MCHHVFMCIFLCKCWKMDTHIYMLLHAQLWVCVLQILYACVVQLRDFNTKEVVFGTVDSTDYVGACVCPPTTSTVLVNLCVHVDLIVWLWVSRHGLTAHLYLVFTALWVKWTPLWFQRQNEGSILHIKQKIPSGTLPPLSQATEFTKQLLLLKATDVMKVFECLIEHE